MFGTSLASISQEDAEVPGTTSLTDKVEESLAKSLHRTHPLRQVSEAAQATARQIIDVLREHRVVFPDERPSGLPPRRPYDQRILLGPGVDRISCRYLDLPIHATLNALTIVPDFPLPPIFTILEMLGGPNSFY